MNYIDLFAGAGGLSEGFKKAGFDPIAHVEADGNACLTLKTRLAYHYLSEADQSDAYYNYLRQQISRPELYQSVDGSVLDSVIHAKIDDSTLERIFDLIDERRQGRPVNLIVGGPPCQAYSIAGRSRMGKNNVVNDERYKLYRQYSRFLTRFQPDCFVFENVTGLLTAEKNRLYFIIKEHFREAGYKIEYRVLDASEHGVLQSRKRVIIFGVKNDSPLYYPFPDFEAVKPDWTVWKALFSDLEPLRPGQAKDVSHYTGPPESSYLFEKQIRNGVDFVTQHITRPHIDRDLEIYRIAISKLLNGGERLRYSNLPSELITHKNTKDFGDRFKVINGDGLSHTVVAHLHKDGHHYIYPDPEQIRSVSVREAARIQSFPDDYYFEGGRTAAFKQIGNAVPPLLARKVAEKIREIYFPDVFRTI